MKALKISITVLLPLLTGSALFTVLYLASNGYVGNCHDLGSNNTQTGLIPIMCVVSFFAAFLPALWYVSSLLWSPVVLSEAETAQAVEMLTSEPISVGQVFTSAGTNCKLRVKAIKNTMFAHADFSPSLKALTTL